VVLCVQRISQSARSFKELRLFDSPRRNALTWVDDELFSFDYFDGDDSSDEIEVNVEPFTDVILPSHERNALQETQVGIRVHCTVV